MSHHLLRSIKMALLGCAAMLAGFYAHAQQQQPAGFNRNYHFLHSGNATADKNFYLLTVIGHSPAVRQLLQQNPVLAAIDSERIALLQRHATDTCTTPVALVTSFQWTPADSLNVSNALQQLYTTHKAAFDYLINHHLRPSGYYQRFNALDNQTLLLRAWGQCVVGINYIIDQFGLGKKMRYPRIDSASYVVTSPYYKTVLKDIFAYLSEQTDSLHTFYQPSLALSLRLLDANDRDEPARHEPMEQQDNKVAIAASKHTQWNKYRYAAIVIPGNGPERFSTPISPLNKIHCDLAALRYRKGWAPFIITSGGYCYPYQPKYAEAIEMKKYLIQKWGIPESAILVDPHARHTTTNFRNANRLMFRYGFPAQKLSLFVTGKSQTDYVMEQTASGVQMFDQRNLRELGYLPYSGKKRVSLHDVEFYPTLESLHMDPYDPLDP